jgi:hypothetical protein
MHEDSELYLTILLSGQQAILFHVGCLNMKSDRSVSLQVAVIHYTVCQ